MVWQGHADSPLPHPPIALNRYAILFYTAATVPRAIPSAIAALTYTVIGLSAVILSGDLDGVMLEGTTTTAYWGIISFIGVYAAVLFALYSNSLKTKSQ